MRSVAFKVQQEDTIELRTESHLGREFLVVPVVALVEGVLQGMNAPVPELALSSEFGKIPDGWNGRPIVMNHPVVDGVAVSANSPAVLEAFSFGMMFNTHVEDSKLKSEAWLDVARAAEIGGEIQETVERIQAGEMVEISTGLWTDTEEKKGRWNSKEYGAVWHNIVPDHLAFLSKGVKGACSVEDGCGTPRMNAATSSLTTVARWQEYKMTTSTEDCGCEGAKTGTPCTCADHVHTHSHDGEVHAPAPTDITTPAEESEAPAVVTVSATDIESGTITASQSVGSVLLDRLDLIPLSINAETRVLSSEEPVFSIARLVANAIPDGIMDADVRKLLSYELRKNSSDCYVYGFTASKVIYETWSRDSYTYSIMQRSYTIDGSKHVELMDDASEVLLMTEIIPAERQPGTSDMAVNSPTTEEETQMTTNADGTPTTPAETVVTPAASAPVVANASPAPRTMAQYLDEMPTEMRESMQMGMKLLSDKKAGIITALKASGRCKFSDEQLAGYDLAMLETLEALANVQPSFEGRAMPRQHSQSNDDVAPPMPELFPAAVA